MLLLGLAVLALGVWLVSRDNIGAPIVMWLTYFAALAVFYSVGWSVEFWSGITVMAGLAGLGLAILMTLEVPTPTRSSPGAST